jgi:hypothetical protein
MYHVSAASQFCGAGDDESAVDRANHQQPDAPGGSPPRTALPGRLSPPWLCKTRLALARGRTLFTMRHRGSAISGSSRKASSTPHRQLICALFHKPEIWAVEAADVRAARRSLQWRRHGGGRSARSSRRRRRAMRCVSLRPSCPLTVLPHRLPSAVLASFRPLSSHALVCPTGQGASELRPEAGPPRCAGR